ncbi:MAG: penicillin-binding protein [Anaerolineae bacterium]|nr:penicillin-binding protein [Anaerolineae bacterium]
MSDRPTNDLPPNDSDIGGWRTPDSAGNAPDETENAPLAVERPEPASETPAQEPALMSAAGWRAPEKAAKPVIIREGSQPRQAWKIPTLPKELEAQPHERGLWHRPDQTLYTDADESVVLAEEAPSEEAIPVESTEYALIPLEDAESAVLPIDEAVAQVDVLPFEDQAAETTDEAEEDAGEAEEDAGEEEDAEDRFSMSQLVALASLAEKAPGVEVEAGDGAEDQDPAEYARQQLEKLRGVGVEPIAEKVETLKVALTPEEQAEANKFHEAESRIRALREQYRAGSMSRDQLSEALKKEMVLDSQNSWWMMGVESDNWYHHQNNKWVQEQPPVLQKEAGIKAPSEDRLDLTVPTISIDAAEMPLPRAVPTRDLDATLVGTEAVYLDSNQQFTVASPAIDDQTLQSGVTMPSPAFGATVPSPAYGDEYIPPTAIPAAQPAQEVALPSYEDAVREQQRSTIRIVMLVAAAALGVLLLVGACAIVMMVSTFQGILSPFEGAIAGLANYEPDFQTARIYAADNSVIATLIGQGDRQPVNLPDVSPFFVHAVLSVEDPKFYATSGFSAGNVATGLIQNVFGEIQTTGGITEQIACNLVIQDCSDTPENRLRIFVVSSGIARAYDPNFILQLYINEIYLGNQSYGIESASQFYFDIPSSNLTAPQASLLAGMIAAPATFDPVVNRQASFDRMNAVLQIQAQVGCIQFGFAPYLNGPFCVDEAFIRSGQVVLEKAQVEARDYFQRESDDRYPHFVNYVMAQIEQTYGSSEMFRRGFQIYTTLVPRVQDTAQSALAAGLNAVSGRGMDNGAVLVTDPASGAIRAMVGSPNFANASIQGEVNNVFTWQPPGDAIFPITYTAALEGVQDAQTGAFGYMTAASILWNVPTTFQTNPPFTPMNNPNVATGPTAIRSALANGFNITGAKAYEFIGDQNFINISNRMGINYLPEAIFGLPASLGTNQVRLYDMVEAYGTLANNGVRVSLTSILRIADADGNEVAVPATAPASQQVQPQIAFLINNILADDGARSTTYGLNSGLNLPQYAGRVGAKSGTSANNADLWTMGYSSNAVVGVWTGSTNNSATSATAGQIAIPVWNSVMQAALAGSNPAFTQPSGIVQAQICSLTGALFDPNISQNCGSVRTELFVQNLPPLPADQGFAQAVTVDTWSGLAANQYCPDNTTIARFLSVNDPSAVRWLQSDPQGQAFAQQNGLTGLSGTTPPAACSINTQNPILAITGPTQGQSLQGNINVTGSVQAVNFQQYTLDIANQAQPNDFQAVFGPSNQQVQNGVLGSFNTASLPNGNYILRLAVYNSSNGFAYRTVPVVINNPLPTATATPPPTAIIPTFEIVPPIATFPSQILPTSPIFPFTPLPFDEPTPTINFGS